MAQPDSRADEAPLLRRMRELEERVGRLEQQLAAPAGGPALPNLPAAAQPVRIALAEGGIVVRALGRALLGMAGAYVLRALTESQRLPQTAGVFAAIVYAGFWLAWAARTPAGRRAEAVLYSLTAALVLGPLLWESTLRFRVMSTGTAAATLLVFTVFGLVISWRKNLLIVATIATATGVLTAAALLVGSHDVVPFLFLLLAIAGAVEISACLDHWLSERWLAAAAADLAVLLAVSLASNPRGLPESYAPIQHASLAAAVTVLAGIYFASILVRTLARSSTFTFFETAQLGVVFFLAVGGGLRLAGDPWIAAAVAAGSVGCGVACYAAGWASRGSNFHVYVSFGFLLTITGTALALPAAWAPAVWCALAAVCMALNRPALRWHGCGYLLAGFAGSGALAQSTQILLGGSDGDPPLLPLFGATGAALACYALALRAGERQRLLRTCLAAGVFWPAAAIGATAFAAAYHTMFGALAPHAYCATLRTGVLAAGAVLLAAGGTGWSRLAVTPLVYPLMALGAYRLLLIDLRQDNKTALVFSLLAYGVALLLLPRLIAPRQTAAR